ncbi:MAG: transposase [Nitrososphaerales archaeon]
MTSKKRRKIWRAEYRARFPNGDKLAKVGRLIDWEAFRPILEPLFKNSGEGRPHEDVVLMTKVLVLQSWYGLADGAIESECKDRLTFQNFLGYPEKIPDQNTIWLFRERLAQNNGEKEKELWQELQRQLDKYRLRVKKGKMEDAVLIELGGWRAEGVQGPLVEIAPHTGFAQDSTIVEADPGLPTEEDLKRREEAKRKKEEEKKRKKEQHQAKAAEAKNPPQESVATTTPPPLGAAPATTAKTEAEKRGAGENVRAADDAQGKNGDTVAATSPSTTAPTPKIETKPRGEEAYTRRSKDGTWTQKNKRSYFGYKLHTKDDLSAGFISAFEVTTASVNDNNVDLTKKGEPCVRDRGYTNGGGRGLCVTMIRAQAGKPLPEKDKAMNRFLSKVRAPVEHPYAVMKRIFHAGRVFVTTRERVEVKMTFVCTCYNLFRALTLSHLS